MKKTLIITLTLLMPFFVFGQSRVSKELPVISNIVWQLSSATGWLKSTDGQWLEGKNKIQNLAMSSKEYSKQGTLIWKVGYDNFDSIELREVTVEGRTLLILIKHFLTHKEQDVYSTKDNSAPAIAFLTVDKNTAVFDSKRNCYEMSIFYSGVMNASTKYLDEIKVKINEMAVKYSWISTSKGTTDKMYFYFKSSDDDATVGRFVISTNLDAPMKHLWLPIPETLNLRTTALKEYYFELPIQKITPLVDLVKPMTIERRKK